METNASFGELDTTSETSQANAGAANTNSESTQQQQQTQNTNANANAGATTNVQFTDADAQETMDVLAQMGFNKSNVHQLVQQGQSLQTINYWLQTNPKKFFDYLETVNPEMFEKAIDAASDFYLERHPPNSDDTAQGSRSRAAASDISNHPAMRAMQARLDRVEQERREEKAANQLAAAKQGYEQKVDSLFKTNEGLKKLPARDQKALKAMLYSSITQDRAAVERIQSGVYGDIPRHLQPILADWTADTVSASQAETNARKTVENNATKEVAAGANNNGSSSQTQSSGDPWDDAAAAIAGELNKAKGKK